MANEDRKRYKNEIIQFEKFGYYIKYNIYNKKNYFYEDVNEKSDSTPKINFISVYIIYYRIINCHICCKFSKYFFQKKKNYPNIILKV